MEGEDVQWKRFFMSSLGSLVRMLFCYFTSLLYMPSCSFCHFISKYISVFIFSAILYAVHLTDKEGFEKLSFRYNAGFLSTVFTLIDNYSPFHEVNITICIYPIMFLMKVLESDEELLEKLRNQQHQQSTTEPPPSKQRVFR